jgi:hypothetical protein
MQTRIVPTRPPTRPHCYICGAVEDITDDHLPPKGFFPPTQRDNLITAPLCKRCHTPLAKTDEVMRLWFASPIGRSSAAQWIWEHKVVRSTLPRSPKLLANIQPFLRQIHLRTPNGLIPAMTFSMPQARAIPFIRRLTKGLLYSFYPDYDYFPDFFTVDYRLPTPEAKRVIGGLVKNLIRIDRGEGVFSVWHGITQDTRDAGAWVYVFYEAACFICFHGKREMFSQQFSSGYKEDQSLPSSL